MKLQFSSILSGTLIALILVLLPIYPRDMSSVDAHRPVADAIK